MRVNARNRYRAFWEFHNAAVAPASLPAHLQIALDNRCNFKCVYCTDHRPGNTIPRTELAGRAWDELEAMIPSCDVLAFHGISEFFVDPRFFDLVQRCADAGACLSLNTNGSILTPRHVAALRDHPGRIEINFSLDAATAPTFRRIRGADFDRVIANLRGYVEALAGRRDRSAISVSFVIARSNVHEMAAFVELAAGLGVDEVKFYRLHDYGTLDWSVRAADGSTFDYREECTDRCKDEHDRGIAAATASAARLRILLQAPAAYGSQP